MIAIRTILHPTDFSEASTPAYQFATALARDYGAKLLIMHAWQRSAVVHCRAGAIPVTEPEAVQAEAQLKLDAWRAPSRKIAEARLLVEGDACEAILRVAKNRHCDLIVMGTHGRTGLDRIVLGSVAEQVLRRAPCPVLTVRAPPTPEPPSATPECASGRVAKNEIHLVERKANQQLSG